MAGTQDLDTATAVLTAAREQNHCRGWAEAEQFELAVDWAAMHSTDSIVERRRDLGGRGPDRRRRSAPGRGVLRRRVRPRDREVHRRRRRYLGDAVEVRYRLPRIWKLVTPGGAGVEGAARSPKPPCRSRWTAPRTSTPTSHPPHPGSPSPSSSGPSTTPGPVRPPRGRGTPHRGGRVRHFDITPTRSPSTAPSTSTASLDLADALDLEDAVAAGARQLADLGCTESLDVRRSMAAGVSPAARPAPGEVAQPLDPPDHAQRPHRRRTLRPP